MKNKRSPERLCSTKGAIRDKSIRVFYENCDFLTVKLRKGPDSSSLDELEPHEQNIRSLDGIVPNSDALHLPFGAFRIQYFGLVAGDKLKVLHVLDAQANVVAFVHLRTPVPTESPRYCDDIEFVGLFWTAYAETFPAFCDWFGIDPAKSGIVSRFDYCVDLTGITSDELVAFANDKDVKANVVEVGGKVTYRRIESDGRHAVVVYNKRLDVIAKNKHQVVVNDGSRPYLRYVEADHPVTRVEFRKKARAMRELTDSSVVALMVYARQMVADHFGKFYDFDVQTVFEIEGTFRRVDYPSRPDPLVQGFVDKKARNYLSMVFAYADNYALLKGEKQLFTHFFTRYGTRLSDFMYRYTPYLPVHTEEVFRLFK